jgi:hypothetical protein
VKKYLLQNLIAVDQLLNTLLGGYADETLSSRSYRAERDGKLFGKITRPIIDMVFNIFGDKQHCYNSYISERDNYHLPPEFRL